MSRQNWEYKLGLKGSSEDIENDIIQQNQIDAPLDIPTNSLMSREEFTGISMKLASTYNTKFSTRYSLANYANSVAKGQTEAASTLLGAVLRPADVLMTKKEVKKNPVDAINRRNVVELSQVAYEIYRHAFTNSKQSGKNRQQEAVSRANDFLYNESKILGSFADGIPVNPMPFYKSLSALSAVFGTSMNGYESGQMGYIPYNGDYGIGPLVTPVDRGLDIGSGMGSFVNRLLDKTLTYKAITALNIADHKYYRSALLENSYDVTNSMMSGFATKLADAGGYIAMFGEMAAVTSFSFGTATPAMIAGQAAAKLGTRGMIGYMVLNGGFNDFLDSTALSRKYFSGNDLQEPDRSGFWISRALEAGTAFISYSIIGPKVNELIIDRLASQKAIWNTWLATIGRNAGTLAIDTTVDTIFDFGVYGVARLIDQGEGGVLTTQDYRMFQKENIGKVLLQRGIMRVANAGFRNRKIAFEGMDTGWGKREFFSKTYDNSSFIAGKNIASKLARFMWRTVDAISPNHYKEMDRRLHAEGRGGLVKAIKDGGDYFDTYTYVSMYHDFELRSNNVYSIFNKHSEGQKLIMEYMAGKDYNDIDYIDSLTHKLIDIKLYKDGVIDQEVARAIGNTIMKRAQEINSATNSKGTNISLQEKKKRFERLKRDVFNTFVQTEEVMVRQPHKKDKQISRLMTFDSKTFTKAQRASMIKAFNTEIRLSDIKDSKFLISIYESLKTIVTAPTDQKIHDGIRMKHNEFVDGLFDLFDKKINKRIVYSDHNKRAFTEEEFKGWESDVFLRHNEFAKYLKRYEDKTMNGVDNKTRTLSEISQDIVMGNKNELINKLTFDIVEKIIANRKTNPKLLTSSSKEVMDRMEVLIKEDVANNIDKYRKAGYNNNQIKIMFPLWRVKKIYEAKLKAFNLDLLVKDMNNDNQLAYKDRLPARRISPAIIRNAAFDEGGTLDSYINEIEQTILTFKSFKDDSKGNRLVGVPYSKTMLKEQVVATLLRYQGVITILGDRMSAETLERHSKKLLDVLNNNSDLFSYASLKSTSIGELLKEQFDKVNKDDFADRFTLMTFYTAFENRMKQTKMMSMFFNQYALSGPNEAADFIRRMDPDYDETKPDEYNRKLEMVHMISSKGFNKTMDELNIRIKLNNREVILDGSTDPTDRYFQLLQSENVYDEDVFVRSLVKLYLIDEANGTSNLRSILDSANMVDVSVTKGDIGLTDSFVIKTDSRLSRTELLTLYGVAYNKESGILSFDDDTDVISMFGNDANYAMKDGKNTTFKDLLDKFSYIKNVSTGLSEIGSSIINMTTRSLSRKAIEELLYRVNGDTWNKLPGDQQQKLVGAMQTHFEYWNNAAHALFVSRLVFDKYNVNVAISVISTPQSKRGEMVEIWNIDDPDFTDQKGNPSEVEIARYNNIIKKFNLIEIGRAGNTQSSVYVRLPIGTNTQQMESLAKSFIYMQTQGEGLSKGMLTFTEWQKLNTNIVTDDEYSEFISGASTHKKMFKTFTKYLESRYHFEDKKSLKLDVEIDRNTVVEFVKNQTTKIMEDIVEMVDVFSKKYANDGKIVKTLSDLALTVKDEMVNMEDPLVSYFLKIVGEGSSSIPGIIDGADTARTRNVVAAFKKEMDDKMSEILSIESSSIIKQEVAILKGWLDTTTTSLHNTSSDFLRNLLTKQSRRIHGHREGKGLWDFVNGISEDNAKMLMYRAAATGIESMLYGIDWSKRYGILTSSKSIFTKSNGELRGIAQDYIDNKEENKETMRLIIYPNAVGPDGNKSGPGSNGAPQDYRLVMNQFAPTSDFGQKIAINLNGWIHKGLLSSNERFENEIPGIVYDENDFYFGADDFKNIDPTMLKWLESETSDEHKKNNLLVVEIDMSTESGRNVIINLTKGLTIQTELTSTAADKGIKALLSNITPSSTRAINDIIDREFSFSASYEKIKADLYDQIMFGSLDKMDNALSKAIRRGVESAGIVAQGYVSRGGIQTGKANEDLDLRLENVLPEDIGLIFGEHRTTVPSDNMKTYVETHSTYWSTHQIIVAYRQVRDRFKDNNSNSNLLHDADIAAAKLIAMEDNLKPDEHWKDYVQSLLKIVAHKEHGMFATVKSNGKDVYLGMLNRNPSQQNFQDTPIIIAGVIRPGQHTGIEISDGLMQVIWLGDNDGDLTIGTRFTNKMLSTIATSPDTFEQIEPLKALAFRWSKSAEYTAMTRNHSIVPLETKVETKYKKDESMFVGAGYASLERFLALVSSYDNTPVRMADFEATDAHTALMKLFTEDTEATTETSIGRKNVLRLLTNNRYSSDPTKFVVYTSTNKNIWGDVHGTFKIVTQSNFQDGFKYKGVDGKDSINESVFYEGVKVFGFNNGDKDGRANRGFIITEKDGASGGFKIIAVVSAPNKYGSIPIDEIAQKYSAGRKDLYDHKVNTRYELAKKIVENYNVLNEARFEPEIVFSNKSIMSMVAPLNNHINAGVNVASPKGSTTVATYLINKFKGIQKYSEALYDFALRSYISSAFPILVGNKEDGLLSSVLGVEHPNLKIKDNMASKLLNTNHKFISDLADKKREKGFGLGINEDVIRKTFVISAKENPTFSEIQSFSDTYGKIFSNISWTKDNGRLKNMLNPKLYYASKVMEVIRADKNSIDAISAVKEIVDLDIQDDLTKVIIKHIDNPDRIPFFTPITIGEGDDAKVINIERAAYFLMRSKERISNLYHWGNTHYGLMMYLDRLKNKPMVLNTMPLDDTGTLSIDTYYRQVAHATNQSQRMQISVSDVREFLNVLGLSIKQTMLQDAEALPVGSWMDAQRKRLDGSFTNADVKEYSRVSSKDVVMIVDNKSQKRINADDLFLKIAKYLDKDTTSSAEYSRGRAIMQGLFLGLDTDSQMLMTLRNEGLSSRIVTLIKDDSESHNGKVSAKTLINIAERLPATSKELIDINNVPMNAIRIFNLNGIADIEAC